MANFKYDPYIHAQYCPRCARSNIKLVRTEHPILGGRTRYYDCQQCDKVWKVTDNEPKEFARVFDDPAKGKQWKDQRRT